MATNPILRALVDLRGQIQCTRIQFSNRLSALDRATDDDARSGQRETLERWLATFQELEARLDGEVKGEAEMSRIYHRMIRVKGVGPLLAAKVMSLVDIEKANTPSALWKYAGYGVGKYWQDASGRVKAPICGDQWVKVGDAKEKRRVTPTPKDGWTLVQIRDRLVEGWCSPYNKRLKTVLYLVATSFLRHGSPYRIVYDAAREQYESRDWTKGHCHQAALRKMIKIWLVHLWLTWREVEGLPTRQPYVQEKLGHTHIYQPEEFGWIV